MESWPDRQGQYYYSKCGTVPGRSCAHNYHERQQTPHYPVYYEELQQNRSRESSHWTVPGSRAGAALHEHANWTDADLAFPSTSPSSHFPFTLDRNPHRHQDLRGYQTHEVPEWTAARPATRDRDKGLLREEWQKKWDLSNQVPCNRDTLGTRSEGNYRELEAWATRYRHSLPRRRRIEAELRGASQRTVDNSRNNHQETTMQHTKITPINREFGLYPSKAPTSNTSHMLGMKENTGYQRMMFSQPPGYTAPPPYNSQHKVSPVHHYCPSNWEKDVKRTVSSSWSHFSFRLHDGPANNRIGEKEGFQMSDESQSNTKLKGLKAQREDANTLQTGSPISVLNTHRRLEQLLPRQYSEKPKTIGDTSSRVIEGRKFKLEKKTGGMTIFCLVSRMAANTETPSLLYSKTNPESAETEYVPQTQRLQEDSNPTLKLADEVDLTTLTDQTKASDARNLSDGQKVTATSTNEKQEDNVFSSKACEHNDAEFNRKDECEKPVSTKYPLWREPRSTNRTEKVNKDISDEGEHVSVQEVNHPADSDVSRHDIKEKDDDKKDPLVIDTTCVLVKMELIQAPNKEHVLYLGSPGRDHHILLDDQTIDSKYPFRETTDECTLKNPSSEANNKEEKEESMMSSPESESESFEERAERILGIPLDLCTKNLEAEDLIAESDLNAKKEEAGSSEQRITEEEHSQGHQQVVQSNNPVKLAENEHRVEMMGNNGEHALTSHSKGAQSSGEEETTMDLTDQEMMDSMCDNNNYVENYGEHQTEEEADECAEMAPLVTDENIFLPQLTSPESVDGSSDSTSHTDPSSSPLDSNSQSAKVLCTETQDGELIADSVDLNKIDKVFSMSMQRLNDCQPDDAVSDLSEPQSEALKEHFGAAEEPFSAITQQQLLESVTINDDEPKSTEQQSPIEGFQEPFGLLSCTECSEEEKEYEIEVKTCEEKAGNTTTNVQSQVNHDKLSHGAFTEAKNNTTDTEHSLDLSASDCEEPPLASDCEEPQLASDCEEPKLASDCEEPKLASDCEEPPLASDCEEPKLASDCEEPQLASDCEEPKLASDCKEPKLASDCEEPQLASDYEEPKLASDCEEPQLASDYEEPQLASDYEEPQLASDYEEPQLASDYKEPQLASDCEEPPLASDCEEPQIASDYEEPKLASDCEEPKLASDYEEPPLASDCEEPQLASDCEEPQLASDCEEPQLASDYEEPQLASDCEEPQLASDSEEPQLASDCEEPPLASDCEEHQLASDCEEPKLASDCEEPQLASDCEKPKLASDYEEPKLASDCEEPKLASDCEKPKLASDCEEPPLASDYEEPKLASDCEEPKLASDYEEPKLASDCEEPPLASDCEKPKLASDCEEPPLASDYEEPQLASDCEEPKLASDCEEPPLASDCEKPKLASDCEEPPLASDCEEPKLASDCEEPKIASDCEEPPLASDCEEPKLASDCEEPKLASDCEEPPLASDCEEPKLASDCEEPKLASYCEEPPLASDCEEPKLASDCEEPPLASDCEEPKLASDELTCPELVSQDSVSFLDSAPTLPPTPGSACDVSPEDPSLLCKPLHFSVLDQVFCSTSPDEEHTCHDEAHKVNLQHPPSLRDVVSRIRKHTAPDSENEEEEVIELWDPESLDPALLFTDVLMDCSECVDEDRLSCSSISSHSSGDTVIVAEETPGCTDEPLEVETAIEGFDKDEDLWGCGENRAEDQHEDNKTTDMSETGLSEECYRKTTGEHEKTET